MPIYTRGGDRGTTAVFGGRRLPKSHLQIEAYGSVDELTSFIGILIAKDKFEAKKLTAIQKSLYDIMAHLSGAKVDLNGLEKEVKQFEQMIDKISSKLPKLNRFILPQGGEVASFYHVSRTVCRRAERAVVRHYDSVKTVDKYRDQVIKYLNRMSDLFFVLARKNSKREVLT